jgi:hypothetical protein
MRGELFSSRHCPYRQRRSPVGDLLRSSLFALWQTLTPLGRNEFICWIEDAKPPKPRQRRIERTGQELFEGKKRPCCWAGCIHRTDKAPSRWQQAVLIDRKTKNGM